MSIVHIMIGDDWMRIPCSEVRRVLLARDTRRLTIDDLARMGITDAGTITDADAYQVQSVLKLSVWMLTPGAIGELNISFGVDDESVSFAHQIRNDLFFDDVEADITWANSPGGAWKRTLGRPENHDPEFRRNT